MTIAIRKSFRLSNLNAKLPSYTSGIWVWSVKVFPTVSRLLFFLPSSLTVFFFFRLVVHFLPSVWLLPFYFESVGWKKKRRGERASTQLAMDALFEGNLRANHVKLIEMVPLFIFCRTLTDPSRLVPWIICADSSTTCTI